MLADKPDEEYTVQVRIDRLRIRKKKNLKRHIIISLLQRDLRIKTYITSAMVAVMEDLDIIISEVTNSI